MLVYASYICRYVCVRACLSKLLGRSGPNLAHGFALTQELF